LWKIDVIPLTALPLDSQPASLKPRFIVAAGRQTAVFLSQFEWSGFLPKAATLVLQQSRFYEYRALAKKLC
jgi:hypothetical protein